jgi:hypothetical protein
MRPAIDHLQSKTVDARADLSSTFNLRELDKLGLAEEGKSLVIFDKRLSYKRIQELKSDLAKIEQGPGNREIGSDDYQKNIILKVLVYAGSGSRKSIVGLLSSYNCPPFSKKSFQALDQLVPICSQSLPQLIRYLVPLMVKRSPDLDWLQEPEKVGEVFRNFATRYDQTVLATLESDCFTSACATIKSPRPSGYALSIASSYLELRDRLQATGDRFIEQPLKAIFRNFSYRLSLSGFETLSTKLLDVISNNETQASILSIKTLSQVLNKIPADEREARFSEVLAEILKVIKRIPEKNQVHFRSLYPELIGALSDFKFPSDLKVYARLLNTAIRDKVLDRWENEKYAKSLPQLVAALGNRFKPESLVDYLKVAVNGPSWRDKVQRVTHRDLVPKIIGLTSSDISPAKIAELSQSLRTISYGEQTHNVFIRRELPKLLNEYSTHFSIDAVLQILAFYENSSDEIKAELAKDFTVILAESTQHAEKKLIAEEISSFLKLSNKVSDKLTIESFQRIKILWSLHAQIEVFAERELKVLQSLDTLNQMGIGHIPLVSVTPAELRPILEDPASYQLWKRASQLSWRGLSIPPQMRLALESILFDPNNNFQNKTEHFNEILARYTLDQTSPKERKIPPYAGLAIKSNIIQISLKASSQRETPITGTPTLSNEEIQGLYQKHGFSDDRNRIAIESFCQQLRAVAPDTKELAIIENLEANLEQRLQAVLTSIKQFEDSRTLLAALRTLRPLLPTISGYAIAQPTSESPAATLTFLSAISRFYSGHLRDFFSDSGITLTDDLWKRFAIDFVSNIDATIKRAHAHSIWGVGTLELRCEKDLLAYFYPALGQCCIGTYGFELHRPDFHPIIMIDKPLGEPIGIIYAVETPVLDKASLVLEGFEVREQYIHRIKPQRFVAQVIQSLGDIIHANGLNGGLYFGIGDFKHDSDISEFPDDGRISQFSQIRRALKGLASEVIQLPKDEYIEFPKKFVTPVKSVAKLL